MESREQLQQQVNDLREANAALLDGHGKLSIAYLSMRMGRLEDECQADAKRVRQRFDEMERLVKQLRDEVKVSKEVGAELSSRVERASQVVKQLRDELKELKERQSENPADSAATH